MALDMDAVKEKFAATVATGQESYPASRQIMKWKDAGLLPASTDQDTMVRLYMAVKAGRGRAEWA